MSDKFQANSKKLACSITCEILPAEFSMTHSTKTSLLHHILHLDPLPDHPKSSIGCIKIICGGWEAIVFVFIIWLHG
jgi:hypothetical protein